MSTRPLQLAHQYMDIMYGDRPVDDLTDLLASELSFSGPLFQFNSAHDYIESLRADPPVDFEYKLIDEYENAHSACLVYQFKKNNISTLMAQTFAVGAGKITKIMLLFDSAAFNQ